MPENQNLKDTTEVICDIGNALETWTGEDLQRLHREICGSEIVYVGDSMFAKNQETLDRALQARGTND